MLRNMESKDALCIQRISEIALGYQCELEWVKSRIDKLRNDNHHFLAVYEDENTDKAVGFVHAELYESVYSPTGFNILGLAVLPEYQGRGIGKELISHLESYANKNAIAFIRLNSANHRVKTHGFYENIGYRCDKLQKRFIKLF